MGLRPEFDTWPSWHKIGDAAPCYRHKDYSTKDLDLGPDPKWRHRCPLSNESKITLFRCRMKKL